MAKISEAILSQRPVVYSILDYEEARLDLDSLDELIPNSERVLNVLIWIGGYFYDKMPSCVN